MATAYRTDAIKNKKLPHPRKYMANAIFGVIDIVLTKADRMRILLLNTISGKSDGNIGWTCQNCEIFHTHWSFFDIDHVVPVENGGLEAISNKKILCPSCHRCKTFSLSLPSQIESVA